MLPFSISETVTNDPLELIHSDVWGPSPLVSVCGYKYYVVFIDNILNIYRSASYTQIYTPKEKSRGVIQMCGQNFILFYLLTIQPIINNRRAWKPN